MPEDNAPARRDETPVVEGPSATTDRDNANSGPAAYVIFAIAVALLVVLVMSLTSCVGALGTFVATHYDSGSTTLVPQGHRDDRGWGEDPSFDDVWDEYDSRVWA